MSWWSELQRLSSRVAEQTNHLRTFNGPKLLIHMMILYATVNKVEGTPL